MELSRKSSISTDSWSTCGGTCSTDTHYHPQTHEQTHKTQKYLAPDSACVGYSAVLRTWLRLILNSVKTSR